MRKLTKFLALALAAMMVLSFAGCGEPATQSDADFKVGVIHIGDPADGSGYSYAHDLGIQDMQKNLNLTDAQVVRKINVADGDPVGACRVEIDVVVARRRQTDKAQTGDGIKDSRRHFDLIENGYLTVANSFCDLIRRGRGIYGQISKGAKRIEGEIVSKRSRI